MTMPRLLICSLAALTPFLAIQSAQAGCYENVGCTDRDYFTGAELYALSCQNLGFLRNSIYAERGYCFKKPEYRALFGNGECRFESSGDVPLNRIERANVTAIISAEQDKGCR
ncbi:MAG: YARHG domain-containing protein [Rhodomicrobium sp.]|nr:YARHG domain-containing protein [Rhodomicrobium sp.]